MSNEEIEYDADESLYARIRERLGLADDAVVEVREEHWDFGYCETCSYPEDGFSVHANGEQVWPDEKYLYSQGGVVFADGQGNLTGGRLSVFGAFNEWLNGRDEWEDYEGE